MKTASLTYSLTRSLAPIFLVLTALFLLSSCTRRESSSASREEHTGAEKPATANVAPKIPACNASEARIIAYREIRLVEGGVVFHNTDAELADLKPACLGTSVGFNRYLMSDGSWVNSRKMLALETSGNAKSQVLADVVVLSVVDRGAVRQTANLSEIGASATFPGNAFLKWTSDTEAIAAYNRAHPGRVMNASPQWSVNGTQDDKTNLPINISCAAISSAQSEKIYLAAGRIREGEDSNVRRSNCTMWFAINVGATKRANVQISLAGNTSVAAAVVKNVREELSNRFEEVSK